MVLFLSDMHLGRSGESDERTIEMDLVALLDSVRSDLEALYLVGDVFDYYIEYRNLVPKGFVRFLGRLAALTDGGVPITYVLGNHDPWHIDFFRSELGVRVEAGHVVERHHGRLVHVEHGDGHDRTSPVYNRIKPVLRHPVPVWLYRSLLPADLGVRLARWYSATLGNDALSPQRAADLRERAERLLAASAADAVVFGHSHMPDFFESPSGTYLNPGCWYLDRTAGVLDASGIRLVRWTNGRLDPASLPRVKEPFQPDDTGPTVP